MVLEESRVEDRVKKLGARVAECLSQNDSVGLAALLEEGFVLRLPDGEKIAREELLGLLANRQMRYDRLTIEFGSVQVYDGQVAFLSGQCDSAKTLRGRRIVGQHPFTALYVCRRGDWQLVAIHQMEASGGVGAGASPAR